MTSNPNPQYNFPVVLHGGPKDGETVALDYLTNNYGVLRVHIGPTQAELNEMYSSMYEANPIAPVMTIPMKTGEYKRQFKSEGAPHTCEYREWTEWHWAG